MLGLEFHTYCEAGGRLQRIVAPNFAVFSSIRQSLVATEELVASKAAVSQPGCCFAPVRLGRSWTGLFPSMANQ
jgi:hypothetical protein